MGMMGSVVKALGLIHPSTIHNHYEGDVQTSKHSSPRNQGIAPAEFGSMLE